MLGKSIRQYLLLPFLSWRRMSKKIYGNFLDHPEFSTFGVSSFDYLLKQTVACPRKDRSLAYLLDGFYREYARSNNITSKRWGDKTPLNTFFLEEIYATFPKAKFIHMLRDPYDVVASYLESGLYNSAEDAFRRWFESVLAVKIFQNDFPEACFEVRYESLVANPEKVVSEVCSFLNVEFAPDMLSVNGDASDLGDVAKLKHHANVMNSISQGSVGKGKGRLNEEQLAYMKLTLTECSSLIGEDLA